MDYSIRLEGDVRKLMKRLKHYSDLDKKHITAAMAEAVRTSTLDRKSTRLNSSHIQKSRMPSSA